MKTWWHKRKLRLAQEKLVYYKAKSEAMLMAHNGIFIGNFNRDKYASMCGEVARYEERVEQLMRQ